MDMDDGFTKLLSDLGIKTRGPGHWQPMLAKVYRGEEEGGDPRTTLHFPLMAQPKYDGVRALWDGEKLWSRSGKTELKPEGRLVEELKLMFPRIQLDGELYLGSIPFEEIVSRARVGGELFYYVFDLLTSESFVDRWKHLEQLFTHRTTSHVVLAETKVMVSSKDLREHMERMLEEGFEGQMLRTMDGKYEHRRTRALLKHKRTFEAEGTVVGVVPGKGKHEGRMGALEVVGRRGVAEWRCKVGTGFTDEERERGEEWWMHRTIVVTYQELTKYGVPRFPRYSREREETL